MAISLEKVKKYRCKTCHRHFSSNNSLKVHENIHSGSKKYKCAVCELEFFTEGSYYAHIRIHSDKAWTCDYCNKKFYHKEKFQRHQRTHTGERPYKCSHCDRKFTSNDSLKRHCIHIHKDDRDFKCEFCSETYVFYYGLLDHVQKVHRKVDLFVCTVCSRLFKGKSLLARHMRVHTGARPYKCPICGVRFADSSNLRQHEFLHKENGETKEIWKKWENTCTRSIQTDPDPWAPVDTATQTEEYFEEEPEPRADTPLFPRSPGEETIMGLIDEGACRSESCSPFIDLFDENSLLTSEPSCRSLSPADLDLCLDDSGDSSSLHPSIFSEMSDEIDLKTMRETMRLEREGERLDLRAQLSQILPPATSHTKAFITLDLRNPDNARYTVDYQPL